MSCSSAVGPVWGLYYCTVGTQGCDDYFVSLFGFFISKTKTATGCHDLDAAFMCATYLKSHVKCHFTSCPFRKEKTSQSEVGSLEKVHPPETPNCDLHHLELKDNIGHMRVLLPYSSLSQPWWQQPFTV